MRSASAPATIILADDDPILRALAAELLQTTGHAVIMAEDGREVLHLLDTLTVDLLVTDMLMPHRDGVEVIQAVRVKCPAVKILAISSGGAVGAPYLLHVAQVLGADATLEKPLRLAVFLAAIDDLLKSGSGPDNRRLQAA